MHNPSMLLCGLLLSCALGVGCGGALGDDPSPGAPGDSQPLEDYDPVAADHIRLVLDRAAPVLGEQLQLILENRCAGERGSADATCGGPRTFALADLTFSTPNVLERAGPPPGPTRTAGLLTLINTIGAGETTLTATLKYFDRNRRERTVALSQTVRVVRPPTILQVTCSPLTPTRSDDTPAMTAGAPLKALLTFLVQGDGRSAQSTNMGSYLSPTPEQRARLKLSSPQASTIAGLTQLVAIVDTRGWPAELPVILGGPAPEDQLTPALLTPDDFTSFELVSHQNGSSVIVQPFHHDTPVCHDVARDPRLTLTVLEGPCDAATNYIVRLGRAEACVVRLSYDSGRITQTFTLSP